MAKPGKATTVEIEERVNTVFGLLIVGASRQDILQYGTSSWDVKTRQVDIYIKRANRQFAKIAAADRET